MYPSSYGRLWRPGHGINFSTSHTNDDSHPRADILRSLHIPVTRSTQSATNTEGNYISSEDDDAPFSTAPEYHPGSATENSGHVPPAGDNGVRMESNAVTESRGSSDTIEPFVTKLDFKIPADAFREAQNAPEGSPESFYACTLYRGPSGGLDEEKKVHIHYCRSSNTMERVCQYFLEDEVLGFDLEWLHDANRYSDPRKNVSLIQLANQSRVALFHVALFPKDDSLVSPTFVKIMGDPNVRKVGVAIKADCTRLRKNLEIDTKGIFELSHLYKLVKYSQEGKYELINKRLVPLAVQVQEYLGLPMYKEQDVRSSDWSRKIELEQIMYSATDAYACFHLYHVLDGKRETLEPTPPRPEHAELNRPIRFADGIRNSITEASIEDVDNNASKITAGPSLAALAEAREKTVVKLDAKGQANTESTREAPVAASPKQTQRDNRILIADEQLASYRAKMKFIRATGSAIRSYFIWRDNNDLDPEAIAEILREPPLKTMTVITYILEAIRLEKLPFDKKRLRDDCLSRLPEEVLQGRGRYKTLMQAAKELDA